MAKEEIKEIEKIENEIENEEIDEVPEINEEKIKKTIEKLEEEEIKKLEEELGNLTLKDVFDAIKIIKKFNKLLALTKNIEESINRNLKDIIPEENKESLELQLFKQLFGKLK